MQLAELTASDPTGGDNLGLSVAESADGNTIAVGSPYHSVAGTSLAGAVYVYTKPTSGGWAAATGSAANEVAQLTVDSPLHNEYLGSSVAITPDGDTIAAGAINRGGNGAVDVFSQPGSGGWGAASGTATHQVAELTASDPTGDDQVGASVAISSDGSTIAAGAPDHSVGSGFNDGAAYTFFAPAGGWTSATSPVLQDSELVDPASSGFEVLGSAVAMSADGATIAAGARGQNGGDGAVFVLGSSPSAPTSTSVACQPAGTTTGLSTTCTATVTDTSSSPTTPTGTVMVTSNHPNAGQVTGSPCTLSGSGDSASCSVTYTARRAGPGPKAVTASYSGDTAHAASAGVADAPSAGRRAPR